jgi:drug/metabolite transporter (DMT)-like permease
MKHKLIGTVYLIIAVLIWGSTFVAQSVGMDLIGPFTFQTFRCLLAVLFLIPAIAVLERQDMRTYFRKWLDKKLWFGGALCGIALFVAASLQQVSLVHTDAGKAGFLTALYVVLVPVIGLFFRKKIQVHVTCSIVLAVVGSYLLADITGGSINVFDLMLLGSALCFAIQITLVDRFAPLVDCLRLNCIQCLVTLALSGTAMLLTETPQMDAILRCWLPIGYAGILSMGVAYSLQILGQEKVEPTTASIIMSMESVIAVLSGWLVLNETMTTRELLGCLLMFIALILSQIPFPRKNA